MSRSLRLLLCLALTSSLLGAALPVRAEPVPENATWEEIWFPSDDGTMLHADLFLPKDRKEGERHPVILAIGPYFGSGGSVPPTPNRTGPVLRFNDLITEGRIFERGYAYVQVDSRGYGGSDGCYDLGGAGEQMDAKAAVEWAASQEWSNGRVGMWGKSYDAWTQVMALAQKPKGLAAAVVQSPLIEGYRGFFMNGVHYESGWYITPSLYGVYDLAPPSAGDSGPDEYVYPAKGTATNPDCYASNLSMTAVPDHSIPYWQERDIIAQAGKSKVPVIWSHGFLDANTKPDNFLEIYSRLRGPKRVWVGQYDHVRGNEANLVGRDGFMDEAIAWFEHYLKGKPLTSYPTAEVQDSEGGWRSERQWPPSDAKGYRMSLNPGSYTDEHGATAGDPAGALWSITKPAPYNLHVAGVPRLSLELASLLPAANVVAMLYDIAPDGHARLISRGAYWALNTASVEFDLYPQDWRLDKGHRIGLALAGSDDSWFLPTPSLQEVAVSGGSLEIPFLRFHRRNNLEGTRAAAMAGNPDTTVEDATIDEATVSMRFPPRPKKRR